MPDEIGMQIPGGRQVVLASGSAVRTRLLIAAGVPHLIDPADVDEGAVRDQLLEAKVPHTVIAETLAELKAQTVAPAHPEAIVLGADQVLSCEDDLFDKPKGRDGVRDHLRRLVGRRHTLHSSVCGLIDGEVAWHHTESADLCMRTFSEGFIDRYVALAGDSVCQSVGAYELEGFGAQLFSKIDGDFFAVLGLPLLPVLDFLRRENVVMA